MGEAKNRGSREERVKQAKALLEDLRPASISCQHCGTENHEVFEVSSRNTPGVAATFGCVCTGCKRKSYALIGKNKNQVQRYAGMVNRAHNQGLAVSVALAAALGGAWDR